MTVIKVSNFGGEMPSILPRALPDNAAQDNRNLYARTTEFRPLPTDTAEASLAVSNPSTIFKYRSTWLASAQSISFVRGQINGDTTERTYFSFNDGSAPPRAVDSASSLAGSLGAMGRVLGVPAPTTAPAVVSAVADELTAEELPEMKASALIDLKAAFDGSFTTAYLGNAIAPATPSASQIGWVEHQAGMPSVATHQWNLLVPMNGTVPAAGFEYLQNARFGGKQLTYGGVSYWAVPFELRAPVQQIYEPALRSALLAIKHPYDDTKYLLDPERTGATPEIDSIVTASDNYWSADKPPYLALLNDAMAATSMIRSVLDNTVDGIPAAFYSSATFADALSVLEGAAGANGTGIERLVFQVNKIATINPITGKTSPIVDAHKYYTPGLGVQVTTIRTDVVNCITINNLGQKVFDKNKFRNTFLNEFDAIIGRRPADQRAIYRAQLTEIVEYCIEPWLNFFSPSNILALSRQSGVDVGSALYDAMQAAKVALNRLRDLSVNRAASTQQAAENSYNIGPALRLAREAVSRILDTRFYVYTYVNDWGEESAPSPVSASVEIDQNDSVSVTMAAPPGGRNVTAWRLYRTNTGSVSSAFQFVSEGLVSALAYNDSKKSEDLQEVLPTTTWLEPPSNLRGLVGMPNGVMAGFTGNTVAFCEPYHPYAWPIEYQVSTESDIVAMAVFGQTLVVGTTGFPYYISGADSASMSAQRLDSRQSCVSARSMIPVDGGVVYASPDGLCLADGNGVRVITSNYFTREDWQKLSPSTMVCAFHDGVIYMMCSEAGQPACYTLDPASGRLGTLDLSATAFYSDLATDTLYAASAAEVKGLFRGNTYRTGTWKSKRFVSPSHIGFAWLAVEVDPDASATIKWTGWTGVSGDAGSSYTTVVTGRQPVRLPAKRFLEHEIEVSSSARISAVVLASSVDELKGV